MQVLKEKEAFQINGFVAAALFLAAIIFVIFFTGGFLSPTSNIAVAALAVIAVSGIVINEPNQAKAITFFGNYVGIVTQSGFIWTVPFSFAQSVSLKVTNFNTSQLKVNDLHGNPVEIAAVVVWRVTNPTNALFNVNNYQAFIANQSESALRAIAACYPYDSSTKHSLRGNAQEITQQLTKELQTKLALVGVAIEDVRISHLAYAQEIASAMLKKQQAEAVFQAKKYLVDNTLNIVDEVIARIESKGARVSDDKRIEITNNLLVVLASDKDASPMIKVGM